MLKVSKDTSFQGVPKGGSANDLRKPEKSFSSDKKSDLTLVTESIAYLYKKCNDKIMILDSRPQRILTAPSVPQPNNPNDNAEGNLIVKVNDIIESTKGDRYTVIDMLGVGTFGQVFRCSPQNSKSFVALKIIKNIPAYYNQGLLEVKIVSSLNKTYDPNNQRHIVRLLDSFEYKSHVCLVFELLNSSLLDVLTQNQYRGLPLTIIQRVARQLLTSLVTLQDANIIHCDLKPENILLVPKESPQTETSKKDSSQSVSALTSIIKSKDIDNTDTGKIPSSDGSSNIRSEGSKSSSTRILSDIKLIDFGSACCEDQTMFSYIQNRAPEILLGVPYNGAIDIWSFACVCVELYLGLPLFPGVSQHNQLTRIIEMFGQPPDSLISVGKNRNKYFNKIRNESLDSSRHGNESETVTSASASSASGESTPSLYRLKTAEEYARDTNTEVPVLKKYLRYSRLDDVIMKYSLPVKSRVWTNEQKQEELQRRQSFLDFLKGMFKLDPYDRWTAKQAAGHPFITNAPFLGPYTPGADLKTRDRKQSFMLITQNSQSKPSVSTVSPPQKGNSNPVSTVAAANSIPRPIQQNYQPVQLSHMQSNQNSYLQSANVQSGGFMPLDRRRLSDPNGSFISSKMQNLALSHQFTGLSSGTIGSNQDITSKTSSHWSDEQGNGFSRPMLKRGQAVLPRREGNTDQGSIYDAPSKRQFSSDGPSNWLSENPPLGSYETQEPVDAYRSTDPNMFQGYYNQYTGNSDPKASSSQFHSGLRPNPEISSNSSNISMSYGFNNYLARQNDARGSQTSQANLSTSYMPNMSYSVVNSGYGLFGGGGSMQDGKTFGMMTDFGQALLRPDMDERRRLQSMNSQTSSSSPYSPNSYDNSNRTLGLYTPNTSSRGSYNANPLSPYSNYQNAYSYAGPSESSYMASSSFLNPSSKPVNGPSVPAPSSTGLFSTSYSNYNPTNLGSSVPNYNSIPVSNVQSSFGQSPSRVPNYSIGSMSYAGQSEALGYLPRGHSLANATSDSDVLKLSSSYHPDDHLNNIDNPLISGKGFEHVLQTSRQSNDDMVLDDSSIERQASVESEIGADWDPFFQLEDGSQKLSPSKHKQSNEAIDDRHKDIRQYL